MVYSPTVSVVNLEVRVEGIVVGDRPKPRTRSSALQVDKSVRRSPLAGVSPRKVFLITKFTLLGGIYQHFRTVWPSFVVKCILHDEPLHLLDSKHQENCSCWNYCSVHKVTDREVNVLNGESGSFLSNSGFIVDSVKSCGGRKYAD